MVSGGPKDSLKTTRGPVVKNLGPADKTLMHCGKKEKDDRKLEGAKFRKGHTEEKEGDTGREVFERALKGQLLKGNSRYRRDN